MLQIPGMSPRILYLVVILVIGIRGVAVQGACTPVDCSGHDAGDQIPDPTNCNRYYVCLANGKPSDTVFVCPDNGKFDANKTECQDPEAADVTCGVCSPQCKYSCDGSVEPYPIADPADCGKYYLCGVMPTPVPLQCTSGTDAYFNGTACQSDKGQCCDPCVVYCDTAFTEIADPTNCLNYYFCVEDGYYPEADDLYTCPDGEKYSSEDGKCIVTDTCVQPCQPAAALDE